MKKQIIAVGGGSYFLRYGLKQISSKNPKVVLLPQASHEDAEGILRFMTHAAGCQVTPGYLSLFGRVKQGWKKNLLTQDIIYVGGGNTRSMLALWREWGVIEVLREAYHQGILLMGVSAGAICWFEQGITDSVWPLGVIDTLSFLPGSCCPHYDTEPERRPAFEAMTQKRRVKPGIALTDYTAAHYIDGHLHQIVSMHANQSAYWVEDGASVPTKVSPLSV